MAGGRCEGKGALASYANDSPTNAATTPVRISPVAQIIAIAYRVNDAGFTADELAAIAANNVKPLFPRLAAAMA